MLGDDFNMKDDAPHEITLESFPFDCWEITIRKSHILRSRCMEASNCMKSKAAISVIHPCNFCWYGRELKIPQIPEMTYPDNSLTIQHMENDCGISFNCLASLQCVEKELDEPLKVAVAQAWQESRVGPIPMRATRQFDWTFTTDYKGSIFDDCPKPLEVVETDERINMDKLKQKDKIAFYSEAILFEDELGDNGISYCSVKIRVMSDCFFVLMRYFLRVDHIMVRLNDTRLYYEKKKKYFLREYTSRESKIRDLRVSRRTLSDANLLYDHVPVTKAIYHKLLIPSS